MKLVFKSANKGTDPGFALMASSRLIGCAMMLSVFFAGPALAEIKLQRTVSVNVYVSGAFYDPIDRGLTKNPTYGVTLNAGLGLNYRRSRSSGLLNYTYRRLLLSSGDYHSKNDHSLYGAYAWDVVPHRLRFNVNGSIGRTYFNNTAYQSNDALDPSSFGANTYSISGGPSFSTRLGRRTSLSAAYILGYTHWDQPKDFVTDNSQVTYLRDTGNPGTIYHNARLNLSHALTNSLVFSSGVSYGRYDTGQRDQNNSNLSAQGRLTQSISRTLALYAYGDYYRTRSYADELRVVDGLVQYTADGYYEYTGRRLKTFESEGYGYGLGITFQPLRYLSISYGAGWREHLTSNDYYGDHSGFDWHLSINYAPPLTRKFILSGGLNTSLYGISGYLNAVYKPTSRLSFTANYYEGVSGLGVNGSNPFVNSLGIEHLFKKYEPLHFDLVPGCTSRETASNGCLNNRSLNGSQSYTRGGFLSAQYMMSDRLSHSLSVSYYNIFSLINQTPFAYEDQVYVLDGHIRSRSLSANYGVNFSITRSQSLGLGASFSRQWYDGYYNSRNDFYSLSASYGFRIFRNLGVSLNGYLTDSDFKYYNTLYENPARFSFGANTSYSW